MRTRQESTSEIAESRVLEEEAFDAAPPAAAESRAFRTAPAESPLDADPDTAMLRELADAPEALGDAASEARKIEAEQDAMRDTQQRDEPAAPPPALQRASEMAPQPPDAWLEDIRQLVSEGELEKARTSLEAFREAWPDYPVPEDLLP